MQSKSIVSSNDPDRVYFDIQILNYQSTQSNPPAINYYEERNSAYLNNPSQYMVSIIRFEINTSSTLPVFIPEITPGPNINQNPNLTVYSVTLVYQNIPFQVFVQWIPQNNYLAPPTSSSQYQNNLTGYYNCYQYEWFIDQINTALASAFAQLNAANPGLGALNAPFISWDSIGETAVINADSQFFDQSLENPIDIYFNNSLYNLFSSIPAVYCSFTAPAGMNKKIIMLNNLSGSNSISLPISSTAAPNWTAIQTTGESCASCWCPISCITFTSNSLGITGTQIGTPLIFLDGVQSSNPNNSIAPIITDMVATDNYKPSVLFEPYYPRQIAMMGTEPLRKIDIQVYYKLKNGIDYIPLLLPSGGAMSCKLCFTKRGT